MKFDPDTDFVRFTVHGYAGDGHGWRVHDKVTGEVVATYMYDLNRHNKAANRDAKADAARRNLEVYDRHREATDA